jgi:hypothetical protein
MDMKPEDVRRVKEWNTEYLGMLGIRKDPDWEGITKLLNEGFFSSVKGDRDLECLRHIKEGTIQDYILFKATILSVRMTLPMTVEECDHAMHRLSKAPDLGEKTKPELKEAMAQIIRRKFTLMEDNAYRRCDRWPIPPKNQELPPKPPIKVELDGFLPRSKPSVKQDPDLTAETLSTTESPPVLVILGHEFSSGWAIAAGLGVLGLVMNGIKDLL